MRVTTAALAAVIALVLAGCGDDEDSTTGVDVEEVPTRTLSPKQEIEQKGDNWAALFAAGHDRAACRYEGQPLCERIACERLSTGPIRNCTPPSAAFRKSFEGATVQDVAIQGENAGAKFSNGETVALNGGPPNGAWYIGPIGGDAGREFLEAEAVKLGVEEQIEQVGNEWAPLFARDVTAACRYMYGQPLCEEFWGKPGGEPAEVRRPSGLQESFADATVERVEIKGYKAGAEFSNGELVEFIPELGDWFIYDVGGNAGKTYFEP